MAAIPVAANLPSMKNITYETSLVDSSAREEIERAARRAQAMALRQYVMGPLVRFCGSLTAVRGFRLQLDPRVAS
jgi:orotidine-5'-phosphate decarboxylase